MGSHKIGLMRPYERKGQGMKKQIVIAGLLVGLMSAGAQASIMITEWMYQGANGEFVEITNMGGAPVDLTGWSYDDNTDTCGSVSLSSLGVLQPGQSAVFTEAAEGAFRTAWNLAPTVPVLGGVTDNLGRNDAINIFDASCGLADRLRYGDQDFPGSIRTQNRSGNPLTLAALGANDPYQWTLALNGDGYGSYFSTGQDQANPGTFVPEPSTLALLTLCGLSLIRRRR